jgi:beta-glucosidase
MYVCMYVGVPFGNATFSEGVFIGYRWFDAHQIEPLIPYGHGLSYTTFIYYFLQVNIRILASEP